MRNVTPFDASRVALEASTAGRTSLFDGSRTGRPAYDEVLVHVRGSAVVGLDETELRQDGEGTGVWIARTDAASLLRVEQTVLGEGDDSITVASTSEPLYVPTSDD